MCVRRVEGKKRTQSSVEPLDEGVDMEMDCEDTPADDAHSSDEKWSSLFFSLSPLGERLLDITV